MSVRQELSFPPPAPAFPSRPPAATTAQPCARTPHTNTGIYAIIGSLPQQPPRCMLALRERHSATICSAKTYPLTFTPPLPEHGPDLTGDIITVHNTSFTIRVRVHSGLDATLRYITVALLDTGPPQSFISVEAMDRMKAYGAATHPVRVIRGTSVMGRLRHFGSPRHLDFGLSPTAALAAWACIVSPGTKQHPILLGRESWMRFGLRSYTTLHHQPPGPTLGEFSLFSRDPTRGTTHILDHRHIYPLRYSGAQAVSPSTTPSLPPSIRWRPSSFAFDHPKPTTFDTLAPKQFRLRPPQAWYTYAPATAGNYLVDIFPLGGTNSHTAVFISEGRQTVPFSGPTSYEPGNLFGCSYSPLAQVPLSTPTDPSPEPHPSPPYPGAHALHDNIPVANDGSHHHQTPLPHQGHRVPTYLHASTPTNVRASYTCGATCRCTYATSSSISTVTPGHRW